MITTPDYNAAVTALGDPQPLLAELADALDQDLPHIPEAHSEDTV